MPNNLLADNHHCDDVHSYFPYGFLISSDEAYIKQNMPNGFKFVKKNYFLSYDSSTQFLDCKIDDIEVVILGEIYSISTNVTHRESIAEELTKALFKSEKDFFTLLKKMWGRFLIIYTNSLNETYLLTDATSMRSLFYSTNTPIACSSHPYILNKEKSEIQFPIKYGYPGNKTPIKNVRILTPNTRISLNTGKISRFYPGLMSVKKTEKSLPNTVAKSFIEASKVILQKLVEKEEKICVTLTGGIDSRITLALLKLTIPEYLSKIKFITYKNNNTKEFDRDIEVSKILASHYNLDHTVFNRNEYSNYDLIKNAKNISYYASALRTLPGFKEILKKRHLHIRSNIYEIGRAYYQNYGYGKRIFKGQDYKSELTDIYIASIDKFDKIKLFYDDNANKQLTYQVFSDFFKTVNIDEALKYFDALDIFYWEHRIGTWMPHVYLETDFVFNTLSLPNNWEIIEKLLSLDEIDRKEMKVFKEILKLSDDFLTNLPINPKDFIELEHFINIKQEMDVCHYFKLNEKNWFPNKINLLQKISFTNNQISLTLNKGISEHAFYLISGDTSLNSLASNCEYYNVVHFNELNFFIDIQYEHQIDISLFVVQFDENKRIKGNRFLLHNGENSIKCPKVKKTKFIKVAIRISPDSNENISLLIKCFSLNSLEKKEESILIDKVNCQKINIQSSDYTSIVYDKNAQYELLLDNFELHMMSHYRKDNKKLVVFFNGAVDTVKTPLPVFQRWSWLEKLPYSSIIIMDPTIYEMQKQMNDKTFIGWYQGSYENFILEKIVMCIENIIKKLNISPENVVFYGSSAGGFASLVSASILHGSKACVVNPQIDILKYHQKSVNKLLTYLRIGKNETFLEKEKNFPQVFYKQNKLDENHYLKHYIYFKNEYSKLGYKEKLFTILTSDERGHSAIPLFEEALKDIEKTFEVFSNKKININFFGLIKNESIIYDFKPRKDLPSYKLVFPIDWSIDPFNDRNWCFQLHAWRMIDVLLIEYEHSGEIEKIIKSLDIITDWERFTIIDKNEGFYTWYDMSTGLRALKLAYILNRISEDSISKKINETQKNMLLKLAKIHIEKLRNQKISKNNHGIFQVHGLLMLAWFFSDRENVNYTLEQMEILIKQQFYMDGFHVENSDEYHWFVFKIFNDLMPFEAYKNVDSLQEVIQNAQNCKKWTVFPNRRSLMIGDSGDTSRRIDVEHVNDNSVIIKFFKDAGYLFIRSAFETQAEDSSMLFLQTAYKNNTHRHSDDFNILLYEYGLNILVDAGKHSYDYNSLERKYVTSTRAHNVVMIDNINYDIKDKLFYESVLEYCNEVNGVYEIKTSLHREKLGVTHSRFIVYKPKAFCIVIDRLDSEKIRRYDQFWHFHQDLEILEVESGFTTDINEDVSMFIEPSMVNLDKWKVTLENDKINTRLIRGQTEPELQGWRSLKYKELIENYALQNSIEVKNALLITKFIFSDDTFSKPDLNINITNEKGKFYCDILSNTFGIQTTICL